MAMQAGKRRLAIFQRADGVHHQDHVEGPGQGSDEVRIFDVADRELEVRMQALGLGDHCRADIDAEPKARTQRRQDGTGRATYFKNTQTFRDQEFQIAKVFLMEKGGPLPEKFALRGGAFRMSENGGFADKPGLHLALEESKADGWASTGALQRLVQAGGLEPPTSGSTDQRSNQLSYACTRDRFVRMPDQAGGT